MEWIYPDRMWRKRDEGRGMRDEGFTLAMLSKSMWRKLTGKSWPSSTPGNEGMNE